jgi:hypothetical protein
MAMNTTSTLSGRDRAILRAVAAGGAELQLGSEPDLFFDGRCCCDQSAAHQLVRAGFIAAATLGLVGRRVAATLTAAGHEALGNHALAA